MADERQQNSASSTEKTSTAQSLPHPPKFPGGDKTAEAASWKAIKYPNPPDPFNPDAATLSDQWQFASRKYSRWYSFAWGTAILAGVSFYPLGWFIKGSNPIPSISPKATDEDQASTIPDSSNAAK
ncbi:hypothetical protein HPP92_008478 [Vanilla planifolia]|uniref:Uncharacterized protein n=1 Tax=Vanilla planifolia TaxID=51239 RepID=A0A835R6G2_VANPL|nr:hypothetical protein HPP92_008637 [Vanilla planifolia]KAG0486383.1 hypothetical protein HPP92_008478 [Vanilla planifolia]